MRSRSRSPSWSRAAPEASAPAEILPLDQVRPGMNGRRPHRVRGHADRGVPGRDHRRPRERIGPKQSMILARLDGRPAREDRRHRGHERQPGLHRRQAGGRGGLRLPLLEGDDRRHHAHRRDDRGHAHSTRRAPARQRAPSPALRDGRRPARPRSTRPRSSPPSDAPLRRCPSRAPATALRRLAGEPVALAARPSPRLLRLRPAAPSTGRAAYSPASASRP